MSDVNICCFLLMCGELLLKSAFPIPVLVAGLIYFSLVFFCRVITKEVR